MSEVGSFPTEAGRLHRSGDLSDDGVGQRVGAVARPIYRVDGAIPEGGDRPGVTHVFIVGSSRSGTTLMRRVLERSPDIAISSENHFMGHLIEREGVRYRLRRFGDLHDDANVHRMVEYIYSDQFMTSSRWRRQSSHWRFIRRAVPAAEFEQRIVDSDRSERAIFDAILDSYAERKGKRIRGEKTPAHLRHVSTLLRWYANGLVVHMLRDPRAIYVSEVRRRAEDHDSFPYRYLVRVPVALKLFAFVQTAATWLEGVRHAQRNRRRYGDRYVIVRFENLVTDPEAELRRICRIIGVDFTDAMLDQQVVSRGFSTGSRGFDPEAAVRWRGRIEGWAVAGFRFTVGRAMRRSGYAP